MCESGSIRLKVRLGVVKLPPFFMEKWKSTHATVSFWYNETKVKKMDIIKSKNNERIKALKKLETKKERDRQQSCLVEGEHLIEECFHQGILKQLILLDKSMLSYPDIPTLYVSQTVADHLSKTQSGSTCFGVVSLGELPMNETRKILLCDDVQDPGNLGTIIRTALSFGFDGVFCSQGCADFYNEKTIRSSQGAIFQMPLRRVELAPTIEHLKRQGSTILGTDVHHGQPLSSFTLEKVGIVLGSEGQGVSSEILALCDGHVMIEMNRFESLNVAIAAGIICYHFRDKHLETSIRE